MSPSHPYHLGKLGWAPRFSDISPGLRFAAVAEQLGGFSEPPSEESAVMEYVQAVERCLNWPGSHVIAKLGCELANSPAVQQLFAGQADCNFVAGTTFLKAHVELSRIRINHFDFLRFSDGTELGSVPVPCELFTDGPNDPSSGLRLSAAKRATFEALAVR